MHTFSILEDDKYYEEKKLRRNVIRDGILYSQK